MSLSQILEATKTIAALPDIASPEAAPDLSAHIAAAKTFANHWIQTQAPEISSGVQAVSALSNNWNNAFKHQIESMENKPQDRVLIKAIMQTVAHQCENAKAIFDELKSRITGDTREAAALSGDLTSDATRIHAKLTGDASAIKALQSQIAKAQAKINDYHSRDWMWGIPIVGWIERGIESLADNIAGARSSIRHLRSEEGQLEADAEALQAITASAGAWISAMQLLAQSMGSIGTSMDNLDADIKNLIAAIDGIEVDTYPVWLQAQIMTFDDQLNALNSVVNALNRPAQH